MNIHRRNLMKGVVTGGTLLALGIPPGAFASTTAGTVRKFGLLLGNARLDAAFAAGVRTAYALSSNVRISGIAPSEIAGRTESIGKAWYAPPRVIKLKGGLLNEYEEVAKLLEGARGVRWIALLDDGSAAVFTELTRIAGARLILRGSHAFSGDGNPSLSRDTPKLRHVWTAASPAFGAADVLAEKLLPDHSSFSIVENFLSSEYSSAPPNTRRINKLPQGFLSYRLDGSDDVHLHCSGLSAADGCESIGWDVAGAWVPFKGQGLDSDRSPMQSRHPKLQSISWVESLGYAIMAAAIESHPHQMRCSRRAFVHQSPLGGQLRRDTQPERFASFVIET